MTSTTHRRARLLAIACLLGIGSLALVGCQPAENPGTAVRNDVATAAAQAAETTVFGDFWDVMFIQGNRVGYTHTSVQPHHDGGRELIKLVSESKLSITRFGEKNEQTLQLTSIETPSGTLVGFATKAAFGPTPVDTRGTLDASQHSLMLVTATGGKRWTARLPWPKNGRGFFGSEQSLRAQPIAQGEHRSFPMLVPMINQVATIDMVARGKEGTRLFDGQSQHLMRVDCLTSLPDGNKIRSTVWTNDAGEVMKTRAEAMQQETFRTSKELALAEMPAGKFDLGIDSMIPVSHRMDHPHLTRRVRYEVHFQGGVPQQVFANCPSQTVRRIGPETSEITVTAIRPDAPAHTPPGVVAPAEGDRSPNSLVQSDDERIVRLAAQAALPSTDPWPTAVALEKFVHEIVQEKNFSQAFASAAEVAESKEGDCTEHAVLLAALLRARGIASRLVIGLVYIEPGQSFGFHMWTEAFIVDRWIPLDATLAQGGIGGAHLKLLDTNLEGASPYSSFLPVAQVLGRLKISVLEAQ